jgi:REP element-mobilizing transposase RayT
MANTFTQIAIHAVFAVARRECVLHTGCRQQVHQYIAGILRNETNHALAVGGWYDHVHVLFEMSPTQNVAKIMEVVKANSSKWINAQGLLNARFNWQSGYGAFAHSRSQVPTVAAYIRNQEAHHRTTTFRQEYLKLLNDQQVPYEEQYLFDFWD